MGGECLGTLPKKYCVPHTADMHAKARERPAQVSLCEQVVDYNRGSFPPFRRFLADPCQMQAIAPQRVAESGFDYTLD